MMTKYDSYFSEEIVQTDLRRLINQIWKLLPMKEKEEDWEKQLSSVLIELHGLQEMFDDQLKLLILLSKLEGLTSTKDFMTYKNVGISIFERKSVLPL